jgi:Raf kinase inhibitor-like YbhB/YbcL family protein
MGQAPSTVDDKEVETPMAEFRLTSPAFEHDGEIPSKYTSEGGDVSPPLAWEGLPAGTKELLLILDDPDADEGVLTHWLVYGILPDTDGLPEGVPDRAVVTDSIELVQGLNEFGEVGYIGPQTGEDRGPHRFFFRLFALDTELLDVPPGATRADLRKVAQDHVIGKAELVGIA